MRKAALVAAGLAVAIASPASASTGPYSGTVQQGETDTHYYNNNPKGHACIDVMASYTVSLSYTPASDTLTLSAGGQTAVGSNGSAVVAFGASYCTEFTITVDGTAVQSAANYTVTVTRGSGGWEI